MLEAIVETSRSSASLKACSRWSENTSAPTGWSPDMIGTPSHDWPSVPDSPSA